MTSVPRKEGLSLVTNSGARGKINRVLEGLRTTVGVRTQIHVGRNDPVHPEVQHCLGVGSGTDTL